MFAGLQAWRSWPARAASTGLAALATILLLAGCSGSLPDLAAPSGAPSQPAAHIGEGAVKVALIVPLAASGNAGVAAQSMRNAAEMALAEFNNPDLQLLVKDDAGSVPGAQQAAQQALDEGAEIVLGPLFALTVAPVARAARARGVPVIAFSTDTNAAARGVYLLSFLPESDVERIVSYAASQGRRSFAALVPDNAYGSVTEAAFKQAVGRSGGRVIALERYPLDRAQMQAPVRNVAQAASHADAIFIPDGADAVPTIVQTLTANGIDTNACSSSARAYGKTRKSSPIPGSTAPGTRGPIQPVFAISRSVTAADTAETRCARLPLPTTPSPLSRRWSRLRAASASRITS